MLASDPNDILRRLSLCDDQSALKELFRLYRHRLLPVAQRYLPNVQDAEEAVEDVFIRLWERRQSLCDILHIGHYLFRSVKNAALDRRTQNRRRPFDAPAEGGPELRVTNANPEELLCSAETLRKMQAAVDALPPQCRLVFLLVKEERMKYAEAAELLNLSQKTVERHMSIALARLAQAFSPLFPVPLLSNKQR